ncbi:hypothetical protein [Lentzea aerocolonigenes]|uniref:hypothetical protein n=1 Tax=Lentzea aerocolonigenes TaxID=68170 RepID=UPI001F2712D6|nr:hypothetical protein [Lentzea aerocolonigenes]
MVDLPPHMVRCSQVGGLAVGHCAKSCLKGRFQVHCVDACRLDLYICFCQFAGEPSHLQGEQVSWDGTGVVRLQQLLTFTIQHVLAPQRTGDALRTLSLLARQFGPDARSNLFSPLVADPEPGVEGGNAVLDAFYPCTPPATVVALRPLLDAREVRIRAAIAGAFGVDKSALAQ